MEKATFLDTKLGGTLVTPLQNCIRLLNATGEGSAGVRIKRRAGSLVRTLLPGWPGLTELLLRLYARAGHHLVRCKIEGVELWVDCRDKGVGQFLLKGRPYEPGELNFIRACLKNGGRFLDIGANIGYFTVLAAKQVGPTGRVIAFEPEPSNCAILSRNIALNELCNVTIENCAAVEKDRAVTLYLSGYNFGDHRMFESDDDSIENLNLGRRQHRVDVPGVALDPYLERHNFTPDVIKIDVQGGEACVLNGLTRTLSKCPNIVLIMELWPQGMRRFGTDPCDVLSMLGTLGFQLRQLDSNGALSPFTDKDLELMQGPHDYINVIASRQLLRG